MAPHTPGRLVMIDDESGCVSGLTDLLRHDGSPVDTAAYGPLALEQLHAHHDNVVLCDLYMPACSGPDFSAIFLRQSPSVR